MVPEPIMYSRLYDENGNILKRKTEPQRRTSTRMPRFLHIVLLQFRPAVTAEEIASVFVLLEGLKDKIPGLLEFTGGPYSSPEGINKGYTHAFTMTFEDEASRDGYLPHPAHEEVKAAVVPLLDDLIGFDYSI
jgi:Stress responsive A/B Barrel Domain